MNPVDDYARAVVIYALCDARESDPVLQVRYIGQTADKLRRRFNHHVCMARRGGQTHRERWMRSVWSDGGEVVVRVLATVPASQWAHAEREAIARYRLLGAQLTNHTDGGEGMPNPCAETRQKLRVAFEGKPLSIEHRQKIGVGNTGKQCSNQQREAIRVALKGRRLSAKTRAKMSVARRGRKHSAEHRAAIAASKIAYYATHPEARERHSRDQRERLRIQREAAA